jgi:hypothetical protein
MRYLVPAFIALSVVATSLAFPATPAIYAATYAGASVVILLHELTCRWYERRLARLRDQHRRELALSVERARVEERRAMAGEVSAALPLVEIAPQQPNLETD